MAKKVPVTEIRVEMTFGLATQFVSALFLPCAKKRKQTVFEFFVARGLKNYESEIRIFVSGRIATVPDLSENIT